MLKLKKQYKYNNYEEIKDWDSEQIKKYFKEMDPDLICKLALEGMEGFSHPAYFVKDKNC